MRKGEGGVGVFNVTKMMVSVLQKSKDAKWNLSSDNEVGGHAAKEKKTTNPNYQHLRGLKEKGLNIFLPLKKGDLFRGGL